MACKETQNRTQYLIPVQYFVFYSLKIVAQRKEILWVEIGAKRPDCGQNRTARWHRPCTVGTVLFKQTVLAPSCTVQS